MASELLKVALKPTCSNSEVKLIDGASGTHLTLSYQLLFVRRQEMQKLLICTLTTMTAELITIIYKAQALAANATFEHTSKIVLERWRYVRIYNWWSSRC